MRSLLAWLAFTAGCIFIVASIVRLHIDGLTVLGAGLLVFWAWGIGVFRSEFWVEPTDGSHPDALGSLGVRQREGQR